MAELNIASLDDLLPKPQMIQLPSQMGTGQCVEVKRPDLINLIMKDGEIINLLRPVMAGWVSNTGENNLDNIFQLLELVPELEPRFNRVVLATVVTPKMNEEQVKGLTIRDRIQVVMWAVGEEFGEIASFLKQSTARVPTVSGSAGLPNPSERPVTDKK